MLNIWSTDWIHQSLHTSGRFRVTSDVTFLMGKSDSSSFSFLRALDMSPMEAHTLHISPLIRRRTLAVREEVKAVRELAYTL